MCPLKSDLHWHLPLGCCIQIDTYAPTYFVSFYYLYCGTAVSIPVLTPSFHTFPSPTRHTPSFLIVCLLFIPQSQQHQLTCSSCYTRLPYSTGLSPYKITHRQIRPFPPLFAVQTMAFVSTTSLPCLVLWQLQHTSPCCWFIRKSKNYNRCCLDLFSVHAV